MGFTNEGNKLLFLHGYLADSRSFNYQLNFFSRYFDVYAPDLKGFGTNANMQYPFSLDDYIEEVNDYKYKNGLEKPHIIAHSFGGRIALKATANDNAFCDKLVLTGCAGLEPKNTLKKVSKKMLFNFLKTFVKKDKLLSFYSKDYLALNEVMKQSFKKIVNEYLDGYLGKIENKTLIIFGEKDKETPLYMARALNKGIKNSRLIVFKDAGHFCFIDKPFNFNTEVREFLLS